MAHLVFFVLLFAGQLIGGFSTQRLPPPNNGNIITVLSIDGGGIRGILPATVLDYLDKALKARNPNTDLAHYFDVIGGTSTGGLITAMLATPSPHDPSRGAFTPAQIVDFYKQNGPHIFNESRYNNNTAILRTSSILTIDSNK
ncbi:patatin-2-Kuras 1-like [Vigna umbellata]|uniref:patatin-2-Kuras 1-like n=1 Tax=Vigna umbellata TaxID=87088 RepID=UPI001F5EBF39|nr:patatin-2-Kuras 1-like [Vigna umbellata]